MLSNCLGFERYEGTVRIGIPAGWIWIEYVFLDCFTFPLVTITVFHGIAFFQKLAGMA